MLKPFSLAWGLTAMAATVASHSAFAAEDAEERTGEAVQEDYTRGSACRIACAGLYGTACATVLAACVKATTITIGGTVVPCSTAIIAACGVGTAGMQACKEACPP